MLDVSSARISKLIVHHIGNKSREEGFALSEQEAARTPTLDAVLLKHYLTPITRQGHSYEFHHESDLSLNTVYHFANLVFADPANFNAHSQSIAKHLYSASTHANIGGGEFIVILFDEVENEQGDKVQALGLFRIEGKSDYLDVVDLADQAGSLSVIERVGIALDKIQKGALLLAEGRRVYVVDSLGQKTKYWLDTFLKALPAQTPKASAKVVGDFLKAVSDKVESADDALALGQRLQASLSGRDNVSIHDIKDMSMPYLEEADVNELFDDARDRAGLYMEDDAPIQSKHLNRYARDLITKARIAEGINLVVSKRKANITSVEVEQTANGLRAVIDIHLPAEEPPKAKRVAKEKSGDHPVSA